LDNRSKKSDRVEIVILNYRGIDDTLALLENLKQMEYDNYGVIVIENGSGDNSSEKLKIVEPQYPDWVFIYNDRNIGFAGGCNQGIEIALKKGADFVLLLNNDTKVLSEFLGHLIDLSKKRNCLAGGVIYYAPSGVERIWSYGGKLTWGAVPGHLSLLNARMSPPDLPIEMRTDFIPGCCLLIPRGVIDKIGLLDEDYFAYVEDVDFCLRALKAGFPSYVTSLSVIHHKVGTATGGGYSPSGRRLIAESSVIFLRKHGNLFHRIKFVMLFWMGIIVASIREGLRGNIGAVREKAKGYRSGWRKELHNPGRIAL